MLKARNPIRMMRQKLFCLLFCFLLPMLVFAAPPDDLTQMDNVNLRKQALDEQMRQQNLQILSHLKPGDAKKYQAVIESLKGKNGDEILQSIQASNQAALAAMSPESRKFLEESKKKYEMQLKSSGTGSTNEMLNASIEKLRLQALGLDRNGRMTEQQKAYFDHKDMQIRKKYFNPELQEKNQRVVEEANAYLKANLERQAEYAKTFKDSYVNSAQAKTPPLPLEAMQSNWLVRKMMNADPAAYTPNVSVLPSGTFEIVKAQIADFFRQLRTNKTATPAEVYGANAQLRKDAAGTISVVFSGNENARETSASNATANTLNSVPGVRSKSPAEAPAQKASAIPGL